MKKLCAFVWLAVFSLPAAADIFGDTADAMEPGNWVEYTSSNYSPAIIENESGHIFEYAIRMHWDPVQRRMWMWGNAHQVPNAKVVHFEARDNRWVIDGSPTSITGRGHAYDEQAIDISGRYLYKLKHSASELNRMNLDTGKWDSQGTDWQQGDSVGRGMEVFPNYKGRPTLMVIASKIGLWAMDLGTKEQSQLFSSGSVDQGVDITAGSVHLFMEYEPANQLMVFGGGNHKTEAGKDGRNAYKLDRNGNLTLLDRIPEEFRHGNANGYIGTSSAKQGRICAGGNGKLYAFRTRSGTDSILYSLDPMAASGTQWKKLGSTPLNDPDDTVVCTFVREHNVIVFNSENGSNPKMYIYKPGDCQSNCPVVDTIAPKEPQNLGAD